MDGIAIAVLIVLGVAFVTIMLSDKKKDHGGFDFFDFDDD